MCVITQEIHIRVQDVSIDEFSIQWEIRLKLNSNKKAKHYISKTKNNENTDNLTVAVPPVFEVSAFKLILKQVCANNFL